MVGCPLLSVVVMTVGIPPGGTVPEFVVVGKSVDVLVTVLPEESTDVMATGRVSVSNIV